MSAGKLNFVGRNQREHARTQPHTCPLRCRAGIGIGSETNKHITLVSNRHQKLVLCVLRSVVIG